MIEKLLEHAENNKYTKWYISIILNAVSQNRQSTKFEDETYTYYESHHILPKSIWPKYSNLKKYNKNKVLLSAREHILCHWLLTKMFKQHDIRRKMNNAFVFIVFGNPSCRSRLNGVVRTPSIRILSAARQKALERKIRVPRWYKDSNSYDYFKQHLMDLCINQNMSDPQIGEIFNVSATSIHNWRRKLRISNRREPLRNQEYLFEMYVNQRKSAQDIANIIGCTGTAVQQYLKKFNIPIRSATERQQIASIKRMKYG